MKKGVKENIIITGLTGATFLSGAFLTLPRVSAEPNTETVDRITITVPPSCSLSTSVDNPSHTATIRNHQYVDDIGETTIKAVCNDVNGFSVYAIGFSDDTYGKTVLSASTVDHANDIVTGTATGPVGGNDVSNWAMRLSPVAGTYAPTIENGFDEYSEVPATYTKVATFTSRTDQSLGSSLKTNYAVYVSGSQLADTYTGKVKYTMVHPHNADAPEIPKPSLYDEVAKQSKGKNTSDNGFSWTSITADTSGVYEWAGKTGTDITATDSNGGSEKVYFYRGILDNATNTYGSNGLADKYPNYVKLGNDTCWRIVRTTSTGGVKMIYNGVWDTTNNTCANAQTNAQLPTTMSFNTTSKSVADAVTGGSAKNYTGLQYQNIHAVGYTYSNLAASTSADTPISTIFGTSGNDTTTNVNSSIIKQYIEDWYARNMTSYTGKLEGDAGYCNNRTLNTGEAWTSALNDSEQIKPYGTSGMTQYYFGAYPRNTQSSTFNPILTCPRGKVDLYSYVSNQGNGNGQLTYPVALLTADEITLAGSGWSSSTGAYNDNSYLRSGSAFWLLSPYLRDSHGYAYGFSLTSGGNLSNHRVITAYGVRPSISLNPGTLVTGGIGTATNPWTVE